MKTIFYIERCKAVCIYNYNINKQFWNTPRVFCTDRAARFVKTREHNVTSMRNCLRSVVNVFISRLIRINSYFRTLNN